VSIWRALNIYQLLRGAPHYPEHVDQSYWGRDAERLTAAGANIVRMGEFTWHIWEPYEGHFSFGLFDSAIGVLGRAGIKAILCTPTATPPRWLAMSSVSRGADGVTFLRWHPAHFGAEIFWKGVIDHDDVPRRRYDEATQFSTEMNRLKPDILGSRVRKDVGIASADFGSPEAHKTYAVGLPSPQDDGTLLHRHCYDQVIACAFIHPAHDLTRLKVLNVPHFVMWKPEWTAHLAEFLS
jgi:beta-galactosidase GanA